MEFALLIFIPMGAVAALGLWAMFAENKEEKIKFAGMPKLA